MAFVTCLLLSVLAPSLAVPSASMATAGTTLFSDGFETGALAGWSVRSGGGGTVTAQTGTVRSGLYAARLAAAGNGGSYAYARRALEGAPTAVLAAGDFYIESQGAAGGNVPLVRLLNAAGARLLSLYREDGSTDRIWVQHSGTYSATTATLALGQWGHAKVRAVTAGTGTSTVEVWLDGALVYQTSSASLGSAGIAAIQVGNETRNQAFVLYTDNIAILDPDGGGRLVLNPVHDAFVEASAPSRNNGPTGVLRSDGKPVVTSYLRFELPALGTITSAKLRMYVSSSSTGAQTVKAVVDNSWSETTITYSNRPAVSGTLATFVPRSRGMYVEVSLTDEVAANAGTPMSIAIDSTHTDAYAFNSKDAAGNRVELVVEHFLPQGGLEWTRPFSAGRAGGAFVSGVALAGGATYIVGKAGGNLTENPPGDMRGWSFLRRYGADGQESWTHQFNGEGIPAIAADGGGVLVADTVPFGQPILRRYASDGEALWTRDVGFRMSVLAADGSAIYAGGNLGSLAVVQKLDASANELWTREFGTATTGIAVKGSALYVVGTAGGVAVVRKFDNSGTEVWSRQFGSTADGIAVDGSGAYVVGTAGAVTLMRKYDEQGNTAWTAEIASTADDRIVGVASGASGPYVVNTTTRDVTQDAEYSDVLVLQYTSDGQQAWARQIGSSGSDNGAAIAVDASGIYVGGNTEGALPGQVSTGDYDAFVAKYEETGADVWTRQFGSTVEAFDAALDVAVAGDVYVGGTTFGSFPGETLGGETDSYVRKYGPDGNAVWTRQFTAYVRALAADPSGVYLVGLAFAPLPGQADSPTGGFFLRKYGHDGDLLWTRQFEAYSQESALDVAVHGSAVYVVGGVAGNAFLKKYDTDGNDVWTRLFATAARKLTANESGVYVAGETPIALPGQVSAGELDVFVRKYDSGGSEIWTHQFGSSGSDVVGEIAATSTAVYVVGHAADSLPDQSAGNGFFARRLDLSGTETWTRQFYPDDPSETKASSGIYVAVDDVGMFVGGMTQPAPEDDFQHPFVRRYDGLGNEMWTVRFRLFATTHMTGMAPGGSSTAYVSGATTTKPGHPLDGIHDSFVAKLCDGCPAG
jgi:hypothetical protein